MDTNDDKECRHCYPLLKVILTLPRATGAQLDLALLVGELGGRLAKEDVEPALVRGVGHQDEDGEEEEGEDSLPHLNQVLPHITVTTEG